MVDISFDNKYTVTELYNFIKTLTHNSSLCFMISDRELNILNIFNLPDDKKYIEKKLYEFFEETNRLNKAQIFNNVIKTSFPRFVDN